MRKSIKMTRIIALFVLTVVTLSCASQKELAPRELIWEISEKTVDCEGVAPQRCLLVREQGATDWIRFYDQIEGLNYQKGYAYTVSVRETNIPNPPADASSKKYELITILSQRNVSALVNGVPILEGAFSVTRLNGRNVSDKALTLNFDSANLKLNGFSGCNTYNLKYKQRGYQLRFAQVSTSRNYCPDVGSLEKEFLITYIQGDRFTLEKGVLKIYDLENQILEAQEEQ